MAADAHKNFAYGTVLTAPSPATSGTSLVLNSGQGANMPAVPFNATVWPAGAIPTVSNAEVVRVTARSTDTLTITRTQESSSARTIIAGDQFAATITAKTLTDAENPSNNVRRVGINKVNTTGTVIAASYTTYASVTANSAGGECVADLSFIFGNGNSGANRDITFKIQCDGVDVTPAGLNLFAYFVSGSTPRNTAHFKMSSTPSAGSHTWTLQVLASAGSAVIMDQAVLEITEVLA